MFWGKQSPFCLFLRSYTMGHSAGYDDLTDMEWLDTSEPVGGRLLEVLAGALQDRVGLVAIANPAEWLPHRLVSAPFANLVVDEKEWRKVVAAVIPAAQLIVVHRAGPSPGVNAELDLIRAAGRVDSTIVVREPALGDSRSTQSRRRPKSRRGTLAGGAAVAPDLALGGFSTLEWRDETLGSLLSESVERLLKARPKRHFGSLAPLAPAWAPVEEGAAYRSDARRGYEMADRLIDAGDFVMAEELLFECFATSCGGDDVGGRASACLALGKLFLLRIEKAHASLIPLEYASGHFNGIGVRDYALEALHLFAGAHLMCGNISAAQVVLEQAENWQQTKDHREWQSRFWQVIKDRAPDASIASSVAQVIQRGASKV